MNDSAHVSVLLFSGGRTGDNISVSLYLTLVVSLTVLVALVVLLVNCVTCCKEREINFKVSYAKQAAKQIQIHLALCTFDRIHSLY